MCAVCRKNPCDSRCPNAEEPSPVYTCEWCKEPIYEGDEYMDTPERPSLQRLHRRHERHRIL